MDQNQLTQKALDFARALDADRYDLAGQVLSHQCIYEAPTGLLNDTQSILDSYRTNSEKAHRIFDKVLYDSGIYDYDSDSVTILYTDLLEYKGLQHIFRCKQQLYFDKQYLIVRIQHEEIPGEKEKFYRFLEKCGLGASYQ